ncbi:unnamed protein product [Colletotrichum noveboracense]|uniref:tRNA (guanine(26)-N(2))-dimethyltransferase n=1 Tax=Colletotrichum noveboracense TaxID=2664923 RepID=A0A9W4RUB2_9PEZI|nr:unnamed protein product [Colletotrichum noveboracense]
MRELPPLQLDGIESEREEEMEIQAENDAEKSAAKEEEDKGAFDTLTGFFQPQTNAPPKKPKHRRIRYRFLTPSEWAIFAHGIGGVKDTEGHVALHPTCWYYPPKGIPSGLYRDVIWHRTKYFYFYHGMSTIRWFGYILQIILGAVLTAIGSMSFKNGTPITIIAASNTINAGILALLHNSGLPDRYRSDQAEFSEVEDHIKKVLDTGVVPEDMTVDQALVQCFDLYWEAKQTIQANIPAVYTPSSVLQSGQRAPEKGQKEGQPGTPGQAPGNTGRGSVIASRVSASASAANAGAGDKVKENFPSARRCSTQAGEDPKIEKMGAEDPVFTYDGKEFKGVKEGKATILVPAEAAGKQGKQQVFYNPIQQFNRDLSVLAIRAYGEEVVERRAAQPASKRKEKKRRRAAGDDGGDRPAKVQVTDDGKPAETTNGEAQSAQTESGAANDAKAETEEIAPPGATEPQDAEDKSAPEKKAPKFTILDALSASGLRALRYSHELPFVTSVTANDLTKSAVESIKLNAKHNGLDDKVQANHDDAIAHMYRRIADDLSKRDRFGNPSKENKYDVIDLDPYGTAAPFIDAAVQAVRDDGGLLCVTCTDASHWAGHCYAEKSFSLYGGVPIKGLHSHEVGLRIIIHALTTAAAKYGLTIEPQLSLSIDFYCRIFVKVRKSKDAVNYQGGKTMIVYNCPGCSAWETQPMVRTRPYPKKKDGYFYKHGLSQGPPTDSHCQHCGSAQHIAGPMYGGPLHNAEFIERILDLIPTVDKSVYQTTTRIEGMLQTALEEYIPGPEPAEAVDPKDKELARIDHYPFFVMPSKLAGTLNTQQPPDDVFRGALRHLGYRVTRSHCRPGSVKTDAPWEAIWFIMREWVRQKAPVRTDKINSQMPAYTLLGLNKAEKNGDAKSTDEIKETEEATTTEAKKAEVTEEGDKTDVEMQDSTEETAKAASQEELRRTLVFDEKLAQLGKRTQGKKLVRYQMNPRENWGPMTRAKGQ